MDPLRDYIPVRGGYNGVRSGYNGARTGLIGMRTGYNGEWTGYIGMPTGYNGVHGARHCSHSAYGSSPIRWSFYFYGALKRNK